MRKHRYDTFQLVRRVKTLCAYCGKRTFHTQNNYVHSILSDRYTNFNLEQCYFGSNLIVETEHQADLNNTERRRLNIDSEFHPTNLLFESEKAAVIVAIALMWGGAPFTFIPMATSGCGNLNPTFEAKRNPNHKIQVLKNSKVVLFPDAWKFDKWKAQDEKLKGFCQEIYISTVMGQDLHPDKVDCEITKGVQRVKGPHSGARPDNADFRMVVCR